MFSLRKDKHTCKPRTRGLECWQETQEMQRFETTHACVTSEREEEKGTCDRDLN